MSRTVIDAAPERPEQHRRPARAGRAARRGVLGVVLVAVLALLAGCGSIPADPEGTLDRVRGGFLRVGVSPHPPWTDVSGPVDGEQRPTGSEVELVTAFAESLDAEVHWTAGGEEELVGALSEGKLDLVIGGLTGTSPWSSHAAITRPYVTVPGADGSEEMHVMAAPMGENAFLVALERFLAVEVPGSGAESA